MEPEVIHIMNHVNDISNLEEHVKQMFLDPDHINGDICKCGGWTFFTSGQWCERYSAKTEQLIHIQNTTSFVSKEESYGLVHPIVCVIHDNGGKPFTVELHNGILKIKGGVEMEMIDFEGMWTGFDPSPFDIQNNSVLIKVNKYSYIVVQSNILSFETDEEIVDFVAVMGNNDVSYPFAYGSDCLYMLFNGVWVEKRFFSDVDLLICNADDLPCKYEEMDMERHPLKNQREICERDISKTLMGYLMLAYDEHDD